MGENTKVPAMIALAVAIILIAAGAYYLLGGGSEQRSNIKKSSLSNSDSSILYSFTDRGNGLITISLIGTPSNGKDYRDYYINALEEGYSKLKSRCKIIDRQVLASYNGRTTSYSVEVDGTCSIN